MGDTPSPDPSTRPSSGFRWFNPRNGHTPLCKCASCAVFWDTIQGEIVHRTMIAMEARVHPRQLIAVRDMLKENS